MAEVVGTLASVLALLNSTVTTFSLITKLKGVPSSVLSLIEQANHLEQVLKSIQSNSVLDPESEPLKSILHTCTTDLSDSQKRLRTVARKLGGNPIDKRWGAVIGVAKEKEILESARKIEGHKTSLLLLLETQSLFDSLCPK